MRILALATDAYGGFGGIAQANRDLFEVLTQIDPSCQITVFPRGGSIDKNTLLPERVRQEKAASGKISYAIRAFSHVATHGRYDVIFCGHLYMAPLARILSVFCGIPYWIHLHGIEAWTKPSALVRGAAENARRITAVSRYTRREFLRWANVDPLAVRILPNTVNPRFSPGPKPAALLERYGLKGKKVLLTVGRIWASEAYKGHDRVIRVLPCLAKEHPDLIYVIAGDGDGKPRLEKLAAQLGVSSVVKFIGQPSGAELPEVYRMADAFIMPSTGEGFGIVFLEAAMSGIPVAGGNLDGSADPLRDGSTGLLFNPADESELKETIQRLLTHPENCASQASAFSRENLAIYARQFFPKFLSP